MKQLNKQLEVNLNLLEKNTPGNNDRGISEGVIILFLILLGCVGFFYSLPNSQALSLSAITTNTGAQNNYSSQNIDAPVRVVGKKLAGERIFFTIPAYDSTKAYEIKFGDGKSEQFTSATLNHTYDEAGEFKVQFITTSSDAGVDDFYETIKIETGTALGSVD